MFQTENTSIQGDYKNLVFLLGRQRSGSTLLRSYLNSHPNVVALGELFFPDLNQDFLVGFYKYWSNAIKDDPQSLCIERDRTKILRNYFRSVLGVVDFKATVVVDVKYSQADAAPAMFDFINLYNVPTIHLVRRNVLAARVSDAVSQQRHTEGLVLHAMHKRPAVKVQIPIDGLLDDLSQRVYEHEYYTNKIEHNHLLKIEYEDIFDPDVEKVDCPQAESDKICDFLSCERSKMSTRLVKQGLEDFREAIINWSEVKKTVEKSNLAYLVSTL